MKIESWSELSGLQSSQLLCYTFFLYTDFIFIWISLWNTTDVLFQRDQGKNVASAVMGINFMVPIKSQTMSQNCKVYDTEMNLISITCIRPWCKTVTICWWVENISSCWFKNPQYFQAKVLNIASLYANIFGKTQAVYQY